MNIEKITKHVVIVKSLVLNEKGEVLLVRRKWIERPDLHDKWEFPGGKLDFGEQPEHTAIRETREETGYFVKVLKLLPKIISYSKESEKSKDSLTLICYLCFLTGGEMTLGDHNVSEIKWVRQYDFPNEQECISGTNYFLELYKSLGGKHDT